MTDWDVTNSFRTIRAAAGLFWGCGSLYFFIRKKYKTFLFFSIALYSHSVLSMTVFRGTAWGVVMLTLIGLLIVALALSGKELWALDQTGKKAYEIFKWDKVDYIVLGLLLGAWILLRIYILKK